MECIGLFMLCGLRNAAGLAHRHCLKLVAFTPDPSQVARAVFIAASLLWGVAASAAEVGLMQHTFSQFPVHAAAVLKERRRNIW